VVEHRHQRGKEDYGRKDLERKNKPELIDSGQVTKNEIRTIQCEADDLDEDPAEEIEYIPPAGNQDDQDRMANSNCRPIPEATSFQSTAFLFGQIVKAMPTRTASPKTPKAIVPIMCGASFCFHGNVSGLLWPRKLLPRLSLLSSWFREAKKRHPGNHLVIIRDRDPVRFVGKGWVPDKATRFSGMTLYVSLSGMTLYASLSGMTADVRYRSQPIYGNATDARTPAPGPSGTRR
jgi:hypothetical protein